MMNFQEQYKIRIEETYKKICTSVPKNIDVRIYIAHKLNSFFNEIESTDLNITYWRIFINHIFYNEKDKLYSSVSLIIYYKDDSKVVCKHSFSLLYNEPEGQNKIQDLLEFNRWETLAKEIFIKN